MGAALVIAGGVGAWQVNAAMTRLESESTEPISTGTVVSHLVPGVVANPGRYLAAVNSAASSISGDRDPIEVTAWLDQKEAVDRFEAVIGLGIACLLAAVAGWPRSPSRPGYLADDPAGSIGSDLLPFVLVASAFLAAISFFELI
jgi:hypothetical protein